MPMYYEFNIPRPGDQLKLILETGRSIIIIGSNGSGKTRLGVYLESQIPAQSVQRIAAQKSLTLSDNISLISLERADRFLRFGIPDGTEQHKAGSRWGNTPATHMLSDFDALQQALFASHNRVATMISARSAYNPEHSRAHNQARPIKEDLGWLVAPSGIGNTRSVDQGSSGEYSWRVPWV